MAKAGVDIEHVRELIRFSDELDRQAEALANRLPSATKELGAATHQLATWDAIDHTIATLPSDPPFPTTRELAAASKQKLAELEEEWIARTVDAEIGPVLLTRLNAARDMVRNDLAVHLAGMSAAERQAVSRENRS